jgi:hypothetical protein
LLLSLCEPQKRNELAFFWQIISEFHLTAIKILVKVKYITYAFFYKEKLELRTSIGHQGDHVEKTPVGEGNPTFSHAAYQF